jgi:hypothetical protein
LRRSGTRAERNDLGGGGREATRDRGGDLAGARSHDCHGYATEQSLYIGRCLLVERVCHRERCFAATECDQDHVTLFAQPPGELSDDGRIDRIDEAAAATRQTHDPGVVIRSQSYERTTTHAREDLGRAHVRDERGADQRGRERLAGAARGHETSHLIVREEVLPDERVSKRPVFRRELSGLCLGALLRDLTQDAEGLLRRRVL